MCEARQPARREAARRAGKVFPAAPPPGKGAAPSAWCPSGAWPRRHHHKGATQEEPNRLTKGGKEGRGETEEEENEMEKGRPIQTKKKKKK